MSILDLASEKPPAPVRLDAIEIEGYKSIRAATLELDALHVIIGAHGAGKSNLLEVFDHLFRFVRDPSPYQIEHPGFARDILHVGREAATTVRVALRAGTHRQGVTLAPAAFGNRTILARGLEGGPFSAWLQRGQSFRIHVGPHATIRRPQDAGDCQALRSDGANLAPFLYALRTQAPGAYRRIVDVVRSVSPWLDGLALAPHADDPRVRISDGLLRFLALATLLLQPALPSILVLDEPDLGLHPAAIVQLAALIRLAAQKTQILLATQSVTLLDQFDAGQVIVVERIDGESRFRRLDLDILATWKDDYSLGELWQKNVLGGR